MTTRTAKPAESTRATHASAADLPFTDFVVKVHSRCDLACDYCYMYPPGDQSWRAKPPVMQPDVVARLAERIGEHVRRHGSRGINLLLHGGEPLLAGAEVLRSLVESVREAADCEVAAGIQTNGVRLTSDHVELFARLGVAVSLSLDGTAAGHDAHRRDHRGRPSHAAVLRAIELLRDADVPGLFAGLLCVVDIAADPVETLDALLGHEPPIVDLLLPHASWSSPPRRVSSGPEYGAWLAAAFDHWYALRPAGPPVRLFQEILVGLLGGASATETVGLSPSGTVVVETDGTIEQSDALKTIYPGAAATGLDVFRHSFDDALAHPGIRARRSGIAGLADACRSCAVLAACGGGFYPHRYRAGDGDGAGFRNPSVYCADLYRLITHIRDRVRAS